MKIDQEKQPFSLGTKAKMNIKNIKKLTGFSKDKQTELVTDASQYTIRKDDRPFFAFVSLSISGHVHVMYTANDFCVGRFQHYCTGLSIPHSNQYNGVSIFLNITTT